MPHRRLNPPRPLWASALLALLTGVLVAAPARAGGVLKQVATSGELRVGGDTDLPPLLFSDAGGKPIGYGMAVNKRIQAELATTLGRPVTLRFEAVADPAELVRRVAAGELALACGVPFSWARDSQVDYTLPIGLSGIRVLAEDGRLDGTAESLQGQRIGVVAGSLGEGVLQAIQPQATSTSFSGLGAAVAALQAGDLDGVIGDTNLLSGLAHSRNAKGLVLTPSLPYERYAIGCIVPQDDSAFRDLSNLAIARLLQDYLNGEPEAIASVDPWVGPQGVLGVPSERIRTYFESVLLNHEAIRPQDPATPR
ncbi:extracellular substrate binding-like orphan protein GrrP [Synechococcus sp. CS-602]|uniref:extracellular substrate binding-like orphan protein GrrP n=1 Tax=Synechococcaceae TaxID=1890426 RepID=UPI0008FF5457|nr:MULTISPECIES: extracellular substrate binding-like orphan protein GrrP [Synechococcaceae]MCT0200967.1 extracellular substrate binding-like orphan protein GrrP [Synechococcus sp. CS-603]MCT4363730.1 extracellular substrate binding-like orphan protein GrrP [Candidatus Regnicoccus frigidus MAG-AL1]APD47934.1 ABC transporter substrate-binding protein [Synechococcus sp. SynAce01]MCT0204939.1 extracellular substrate binding-like orphan protein GrrP [Synechococcus sp. CS-602]MCT0244767.1 extracell